ncbi:hypothetical protein J3A83DRAFT_4388889 [Scleroderma citrinum]
MLPYGIPSTVGHWYHSRFVLSYKGLPFQIDWVELPDIAPRMKEIGASPGKHPDGSDHYTLPVLRDPNTGAVVTDSWDIAVYLENTYPEKPIFPKDTKGLIRAFNTAEVDQIVPIRKFLFLRAREIFTGRSAEYFTTTREKYFNQKFEEFSPEGSPERDQHWSSLEKAFTTTKMWCNQSDGKWFMGNIFSYVDILAAARVFWLKKILHDDEWKRIARWHDGMWERVLVDVERECKVVQ